MTIFAEQLKKLRTEKKLSQDALAEKLFISRQSVSKWENGDATPDLENLIKLAEILDVSLDQLILGKEPQVKIERVVETREAKRPMTFWEFMAGYWWLLLSILGYLSWFLPHILPNVFR
ncbi:helix-turn-helix transcriptional regulator [Streptococcus pluranimalium]|uniref:helix-turn-helix domain-containing protein n=1 Tax=Streptococcus pluranimalium TaxID=82348 RepID=UPI00292E23F5|nr:helix-turn-helix transcriptional regulator [Streptococcus pluranimalium]